MSEKVVVSNLAWTTEEHELIPHLSQAGQVAHVEIQRHADTSRSKGWA